MATIFQKTVDDKCVVLEPRESLIYPFSIGDWTEVRFGMYFSVTSTSGFNTTFGGIESIPGNFGTTTMFYGLTSTGAAGYFPGQSGVTYVGLGRVDTNNTYINSSYIATNSSNDDRVGTMVCDVSGNRSVTNGGTFISMGYPNSTGDTAYATFYGLQIVLANNTYAITGLRNINAATDVSVAAIRNQLAAPNQTKALAYGTFTNGFTSSGSAIPKPSAVYMYFPFLNNRIRIHSLAVEKYA